MFVLNYIQTAFKPNITIKYITLQEIKVYNLIPEEIKRLFAGLNDF